MIHAAQATENISAKKTPGDLNFSQTVVKAQTEATGEPCGFRTALFAKSKSGRRRTRLATFFFLLDCFMAAEVLKDVQRAYFCPPFDPYMIQGAVAFAVAAREARLEHIVELTQSLASPSHPSLMTRQLWLVDRLFSMTPGVTHTIVRPGIFADAYLARYLLWARVLPYRVLIALYCPPDEVRD